ncbi:MAG: hypothetical protein Q7S34_01595 [bacterium]|nr:hypothetical protein [bacterium]
MNKRTKFYLGMVPFVMLVIVAEATVPTLIAQLAVWMAGLEGLSAGFLGFVFWVATFVAILTVSIYAVGAVGTEMGVFVPQGNRNVPPMPNIAPVHPIRRGPN